MSKDLLFQCTSPCNNCPYRKDAPVKHWSIDEFEDLLKSEQSQLGVTYGCHKNNGTICVGWLMMQDKNRLPSIMLRMSLSSHNVTREYLDSLHCKSEMFETTNDMIHANFPELLNN